MTRTGRPGSSTPKPSSRTRRVYDSAQTRGTEAYERGRLWIANQDPASRKGATIGWVRRYQAADGQLYAVLLSAYLFLTLVPLLLVYLELPVQRSRGTGEAGRTAAPAGGKHLEALRDGPFGGVRAQALGGADRRRRPLLLRARLRPGPAARARPLLGVRPAQARRAWTRCSTSRCWVHSRSWHSSSSWRPRPCAATLPGSAGCSTSAGSFCCSGSSSGRRGILLHNRVAARDILPGRGLHHARAGRDADHLRPVAQALARVVLEDLRRARDRDGDLLLDHRRRHDPGPRRRPLACARAPPRPPARWSLRRPIHGRAVSPGRQRLSAASRTVEAPVDPPVE